MPSANDVYITPASRKIQWYNSSADVGSIFHDATNFYVSGATDLKLKAVDDVTLEAVAGGGIIVFSTAGTERARFSSDYGLTLSAGTPSTTSNILYNVGGSLYFNGSAVGGTPTGPIDFPGNSAATFDNQNNNNQTFIRNGGTNGASLQLGVGSPGNSNTKLHMADDGDIGLGTTAPNQKLDVAGNINIQDGHNLRWNNATQINILGSSSSGLTYTASKQHFLTYNGSSAYVETLTLNTGGAVGIGKTNNTTEALWITDTASPDADTNIILQQGSGGGGGLWLYNSSAAAMGLFGINSSSNMQVYNYVQDKDIIFSVNDGGSQTEVMRIDGSVSRVGIGTTSPSRKLHVVEGSNGYAARFEDGIELDGTNVQLLGYGQGNLWMMGNSGNPKLTLGYSHNWDFQVSLRYIRGATNGSSYVGDGEFRLGQMDKNNANWDHGITSFWVSGSERMRIFKDGNVGIGTTPAGGTANAPVARLHVADTASADVGIALTNSDTGHGANDGFQFYIDTSKNAYLINREASDMKFYTSNAQKMVIKSDGKVGIGTTSPTMELDVRGSSSAGNVALISGTSNGNNPILHVKDSTDTATAWFESNRAGDQSSRIALWHNPASSHGGSHTAIMFQMNDSGDNKTNYAQIRSGIDVITDGSEGGNLSFYTSQAGSLTEQMRIDDAGNVGIGTTAPAKTLHIKKDAGHFRISSADYDLISMGPRGDTGSNLDKAALNMMASDGSSKVYFDTAADSYIKGGNLGIGTSSPDAPLHILKAAGGANFVTGLKLDPDDTTTNSGISIDFNASTTNTGASLVGSRIIGAREGGNASGYLAFFTSPDSTSSVPVHRMRITSAGKVGIGTSAPQQTLHVEGTFRFRDGNSSSQRLEGYGQNDNFVLAVSGTDALALNGGTPGVRFIDTAANEHLSIKESGTNAAQFSAATIPVCVMKEDVGIIMDANQGIQNHVQSLANFQINAGTGINTADIQGFSKIQNILLDPMFAPGGFPSATPLDIKLPLGIAGMEFIVTLGVHTLNLGNLTLRLIANGSDIIYNGANAVTNITYAKNIGESIHLVCFETNKWSVVSHV